MCMCMCQFMYVFCKVTEISLRKSQKSPDGSDLWYVEWRQFVLNKVLIVIKRYTHTHTQTYAHTRIDTHIETQHKNI